MLIYELDSNSANDNLEEDWEGNNAVFTCPIKGCGKVFLVSGALNIHGGNRKCPNCGRSEAHVEGGRKSGGKAWIEWDEIAS